MRVLGFISQSYTHFANNKSCTTQLFFAAERMQVENVGHQILNHYPPIGWPEATG